MKNTIWIILVSISLCWLDCYDVTAQSTGNPYVQNPNRIDYSNFSAMEMYNRGDACYVAEKYDYARIWYYRAAQKGLVNAMYSLGVLLYSYNLPGVERNTSEAFYWFKEAAEKGLPSAQYYVGMIYGNGETRSGKKDYTKALEWLRLALKNGYTKAQADIKRFQQEMYNEETVYIGDDSDDAPQNGRTSSIEELQEVFTKGVSYYSSGDYSNAIDCFRKGCGQNFAPSQWFLGIMYHNGFGVDKNFVEATKWYRKAAEQGLAMAQWHLGTMYEHGRGVSQSNAEAIKWYRKAAEQGNDNALERLRALQSQSEQSGSNRISVEEIFTKGMDYYNSKDYTNALKCFKMVAEQGDAIAQFNLGIMYEDGQGVSQSDTEAVKWYRKAAEQGHAKAQYNLGNMYRDGRGVSQNDTEAAKWYRKAAEQRLAKAQNNLGVTYKNGRGVSQNYAEAVKWYRKSAEQGLAIAQFNLGVMYYEGQGVTKNLSTAKYWLQKAAENDDEEVAMDAEDLLEDLE